MKINLVTRDAQAFAEYVTLDNQFREIEIPLSDLKKDSYLLLPRPYPGFLPLRFTSAATNPFTISDAEKLEISFSAKNENPTSIEVESVWLKK